MDAILLCREQLLCWIRVREIKELEGERESLCACVRVGGEWRCTRHRWMDGWMNECEKSREKERERRDGLSESESDSNSRFGKKRKKRVCA